MGTYGVRRALLPLTVVTLIVVAVQLVIFSSWRFDGVVVMMVWLWPLAVGMTGRTALALWCATVTGVLFDTHSSAPFGLTVLVALTIAYAASRLGSEGVGDLDSAAWWVTPLIGAVAGFVAPALYVGLSLFTLNFTFWRDGLWAAMLVNTVAFFLLVRPATRVAQWVVGAGGARR